MKKTLFILLAVLLTATSCNKDFLDSKPSDQLSDTNFWKTSDDAKAGVAAIYNQLQSNSMAAANQSVFIYGWYLFTEGITPNGWIWSESGLGYQLISKGNHNAASSGAIPERWKALYRGIYLANLAIENLPNVPMDATLKARLIAEAKFLRALFYYNLVDTYGGVPLVTSILKLGEEQPARSSKAEVISFIVAECTIAQANLLAVYTTTDVGRATKGAAVTLQAKAYLLDNKFAEAAAACQQVMAMNYSLYNNYEAMFTSVAAENNSEVIFDIQYVGGGLGEGGVHDARFGPASTSSAGFNSVFPTRELVDSYEMKNGKSITDPTSGYDPANPYSNRDPRLDYTIVRPGAVWRGLPYASIQIQGGSATYLGYLFRKYVLTVTGNLVNDSPLNFIVFRYADVLLMYAEAKNEITAVPDVTIYNAINQVRARPGVAMPAIDPGKTKDEMREIIRNERKIELAFEGIYYSDIRRWGIAKDLMNGKSIRKINGDQLDIRTFVDAFYLWPIPQGERDLNPSLTQNIGY
ncbi:RagB/SusD family nutrient uptake outer membrane protein [Pedobacter heparinus]|uniref:RagB/SusD family nutrient uptake outer membrane protein n=1 Tax=Pedobacter heparinus TaxID=984 RepID=UPI00292DB4A9|nr:RagB/SusD family nutrient uptake outer membrane protein [Pedobacter heparinus]